MSNLILYSPINHIGYITLNRPESGNNIDLPMAQELTEVCQKINQDENIYVVVITGAGDIFCAGGQAQSISLTEMGQLSANQGFSEAMANIDRPTLAALNGDALGPGLELALACDLRIASNHARFGMPQITSGIMPLEGGTQRLPRIVGKGKALEMVLTGETITAQEAWEIGLVNKVTAPENLATEVQALATTIATKAPWALRYCKEAVNKGLDVTLDQGLRLEADLYFLLHTTVDRTEGIRSFLEKRPPKFGGK
jgi:enoyl-CoA hydratase/carnithine racemase